MEDKICIACDKLIKTKDKFHILTQDANNAIERYAHKSCMPGSRNWVTKFPSEISCLLYFNKTVSPEREKEKDLFVEFAKSINKTTNQLTANDMLKFFNSIEKIKKEEDTMSVKKAVKKEVKEVKQDVSEVQESKDLGIDPNTGAVGEPKIKIEDTAKSEVKKTKKMKETKEMKEPVETTEPKITKEKGETKGSFIMGLYDAGKTTEEICKIVTEKYGEKTGSKTNVVVTIKKALDKRDK